ncbi:hypothetical protein CKM354_000448700 [Cercospora kikuchii]|uniref:WW domain-containing protein n=1 Tax=Cercospora kikuchii TaxID=84275 RepID=A0A9P3CDC8_9PEZI|nr:uncharacterized protein CKM354_000448700 [Cercospora kikuchii]GIZ41172.1 hypothetical protein CKM354_000448700 [Cercospora kikuchii]
MKQFSDVSEHGDKCRTDSFICQPTERGVASTQYSLTQDDVQLENHAAERQSTTGIDLHLAGIDPPIGQLPPGWNSFHDSSTKKDYYVSPTGHVQWQHPLQGPPPPPLPQVSGSEVDRSSIEASSAIHNEEAQLLPPPTSHSKRKRNADEIEEISARLTILRESLEDSRSFRTPEQTSGTQVQPPSSSNASALPATSNNGNEERPLAGDTDSQSDPHVRDMLTNLAGLVDDDGEGTDKRRETPRIEEAENEEASDDDDESTVIIVEREKPLENKEQEKKSRQQGHRGETRRQMRKRLRKERKLARTPAENEALRQNRIQHRKKKKEAKAHAEMLERFVNDQEVDKLAKAAAEAKTKNKDEDLRKKRRQEQKEKEEMKLMIAASQKETLRQKRIQERGERRLARAEVNWQAE